MRICQGVCIPMTKIKCILTILIPLFSAIIGLNLMDKYNIFAELNIGPQDKASDVCISVYFAIIDAILSTIFPLFSSLFPEIRVIFSNAGNDSNIDETPIISLKDSQASGVAEMNAFIEIKGKKEQFKNVKVLIKNPGYIDIQPSAVLHGVSINQDGDCEIDITEIIGSVSDVDLRQSFRIIMAQNCNDVSRSIIIMPYINKGLYKIVSLKYNKAEIRMGDI